MVRGFTLTRSGRIAKVALCFSGRGDCVMKEGVLLVWLEQDDHLAG